MPLFILGALTTLILAIAVWAMNTQECDPTMIGEGDPDWGAEPFEEEQKEYRKAG